MILRWLFLLAVLGGVGALIWQSLPEAPAVVQTGSKQIAFKLPDLTGEMQAMPEGEVVLLNFWATWCPPCRQEIPSMVHLHEQLAGKGLKIVAVSVDQRLHDLTDFVTEYKMPFQVLHDADGAISQRYGVYRYPESFLIDRHGVIQQHFIGAVDWMREPIRNEIESMLKQPVVAEGALVTSSDR